ncbi:MAG: hypothetical protein WC201_03670 [Bacilli bacterium]
MRSSKSFFTPIIYLSIAFIVALVSLIVSAIDSGSVAIIDIVYCFLVLFGIGFSIWSKFNPYHRFPGVYVPLLGLFVTSVHFGIINLENSGGLNVLLGTLNLVLAFIILDTFGFITHVIVIKRFRVIAYSLLLTVATLSLAIAISLLAQYATADSLTLVHTLSIASLLVSGVAIPGAIFSIIKK